MLDYLEMLHDRDIQYKNVKQNSIAICCPFHDDSNPSCGVSLMSGGYHCFSCGASGPFYKLIAQLDGIPEEDAKKLVLGEYSAESLVKNICGLLEDDTDCKKPRYINKVWLQSKFSILTKCGLEYLRNRKLSYKTIDDFELRWGNESIEWADRVIIPLKTYSGKIIGYSGRSIHKCTIPKNRKYVAFEGALRKSFFGLSNIWKGKRLKYLIIVEGEFDAMYLQQFGYNAVANLGISEFSSSQISLLVRMTEYVIINYDNDVRGKEAGTKQFRLIRKYLPATIMQLPGHVKDANDLVEKELREVYNKVIGKFETREETDV